MYILRNVRYIIYYKIITYNKEFKIIIINMKQLIVLNFIQNVNLWY